MSARAGRPKTIDGVECLRAGSAALTVLFVGGELTRIVITFVPTSRYWWLPLVAIVAYSVAGSRVGEARRPPLQGALAALAAWALVGIGRLGWGFAGYTPALTFIELLPAIGIGALAGHLAGERAERAAALRRQREIDLRKSRAAGKAARRARRRNGERAGGSGRPGPR